ncbi:hypothetical protein Tco_0739749 [Tanacetum coccineum]
MLEDLSDLLKDTRSAFFTPDSPQDEPIIISDESEEEEKVDKDKDTHATYHDAPENNSIPHPPSPKSAQIQELMAQCQPMNQDFYNSNSSGFDQFQPPQYPVIHHPPQETSKEILQAREDLMEAIQAFLKEYDHIPPNEKCMALLLAEERFLKIKQAMEEEQNQPEVMQELLLKLMNDLQILKGI